MTLKELQNMIKEEFASYHEADDVDVSVSDADVDVDAEMGDDMGDEEGADPEAMLRNIYDMLKAKFEGGEEAGEDMDDMGDEEADVDEAYMDEDMDEMDREDELDELANNGFGKPAKNSSGPNAGYTNAKKNPLKKQGSVNPLQERFQKLANIIK